MYPTMMVEVSRGYAVHLNRSSRWDGPPQIVVDVARGVGGFEMSLDKDAPVVVWTRFIHHSNLILRKSSASSRNRYQS